MKESHSLLSTIKKDNMEKPTKQYIGDGVYIDYNGYDIVLTTEDGITATNTIVLEPEVIYHLSQYLEQVKAFVKDYVQRHQG